jgi:hypothetical protein
MWRTKDSAVIGTWKPFTGEGEGNFIVSVQMSRYRSTSYLICKRCIGETFPVRQSWSVREQYVLEEAYMYVDRSNNFCKNRVLNGKSVLYTVHPQGAG